MGCKESKEQERQGNKQNKQNQKEQRQHSSKALSMQDDFVMIKRIGCGGYGEVFLLKMKKDGKYYVQKRISKEKMQKMKDSVVNEKEIMKSIKSPFIQSLKASNQDQSYIYFYTTFEIGGDLLTYIQRKRYLIESEAIFYSAEILLGIEILHQNNIIHRDIKPENILISSTGHIKITDFGISQFSNKNPNQGYSENNRMSIISQSTQNEEIQIRISDIKNFQGTLQYNSPEILKQQEYSYQADFWAFGILLFMLLKGYHPFIDMSNGYDDLATYYNITNGRIMQYENTPQLSIQAESLISLLLDVNQYSRLGAGGINQIKNHAFFKDVDWKKYSELKAQPPFIPSQSDNQLLANFDSEQIQSVTYNNNNTQLNQFKFTPYPNFTYKENDGEQESNQ